jgi:hypothetical protein
LIGEEFGEGEQGWWGVVASSAPDRHSPGMNITFNDFVEHIYVIYGEVDEGSVKTAIEIHDFAALQKDRRESLEDGGQEICL